MTSPITTARNLRDGFIDYITTTFHFADVAYDRAFRRALAEEGAVARGPYLDIGGSYETGLTLDQLIEAGEASPLFRSLERAPEGKKALKLERPLYRHQEAALRKINAGKSLIVTTGTGSGKTECFLIPIVNHLLRQMEAGTLEDAVYAIVIYPMNALANDQMKRMRALLKDAGEIRFGLYNGSTEHTRRKALEKYRRANPGKEPLPNEALSREEMQERPPHILITNYSMMEYMLLRPKDDGVFQNARLKFIVLDEAHIYRGATGMETSLLLRRMHARIAHKSKLQYILTSATLGDQDANPQIVDFGTRLCGVSFEDSCIVRSSVKRFESRDACELPDVLLKDLAARQESVSEIFGRYGIPCNPEADDEEKLFELCLNSRIYDALRAAADGPRTIPELLSRINQILPVDGETLEAFIQVCARAGRDGASLIRPRYHFFVRALEGAYITIGNTRLLTLNRRASIEINGQPRAMFEAAVCTDCGRTAITGRRDADGILTQQASREEADCFLVKLPEDQAWFSDEDEGNAEAEYIVCALCGAMRADNGSARYPCDHGPEAYVRLHQARRPADGHCKCPACGTGHLRRFYLGSEAATAVLGTDLYEQLPEKEIVAPAAPVRTGGTGLFGAPRPPKPVVRDRRVRQFLCFSDSRSEAANFASYMERSYQEFLRRRGIWYTAEKLRREGRLRVSMGEFIQNLTTLFEKNRSFAAWDDREKPAYAESKANAWTAMLNELYNARRATGLMAMGVFAVRYRPNEGKAQGLAQRYGLPEADMQALLELLVMDGVYTGAIDAGPDTLLSDAQRDYIFYTSTPQKLVLVRNAGVSEKSAKCHGWCARRRPNGNYYPNVRVSRLCQALNISEEEAGDILGEYWRNLLAEEGDTFAFDANDFDVLLYDFEQMPFYRCEKCGRVTSLNVGGRCVNVKCTGKLAPFDAMKASETNHYARLYRSEKMTPLYIREHTAQLSKLQQSRYQEAFVEKKINALSCSTTFEMGVDVGSLETVYMRNVPPSPANYVQRAGRAGRSRESAAFVLTYAGLSSHDFTYYAHPENMISGDISAPIFRLENEKIIRRHLFAIALGYFFKQDPSAFDDDDRAAFLLEGGYERFRAMLDPVPEALNQLIRESIPAVMHGRMGISDGSWTETMIGTGSDGHEMGILEAVYQSFHGELNHLESLQKGFRRKDEPEQEIRVRQQLCAFRAGRGDKAYGKRIRKSLIDFLVRNNILPKYGFPVDTVELHPYGSSTVDEDRRLQLSRDLQMAIAEYAPGSEVIADGKLYKSRYIRRGVGKSAGGWEMGAYSDCPGCGQKNFTKFPISRGESRPCVSCRKEIPQRRWHTTIEPRLGFQTEGEGRPVPLHRPERGYRTDDYYIGDPHRNIINRRRFDIDGHRVILESTANDSLVVISRQAYRVCPRCGYAVDGAFPDRHKNGRGFYCEAEPREAKEYYLSHDFKTDVVKLTFIDSRASDKDRMYSVMYALLEGLSRQMDIERNDIKGCLHYSDTDEGLVCSLILYDAVAGGAGNVRRMVTDDGKAFVAVVKKALEVLEGCQCDSSCYNCLRNYYNQKIHDQLNRHVAADFLRDWLGEPQPVEEAPAGEERPAEPEMVIRCDDDLMADYANWSELAEIYGQGNSMDRWDAAGIPYAGKLYATLTHPDGELETVLLWPELKLALCEADCLTSTAKFEALGWQFMDANSEPEDIREALNRRAEYGSDDPRQ